VMWDASMPIVWPPWGTWVKAIPCLLDHCPPTSFYHRWLALFARLTGAGAIAGQLPPPAPEPDDDEPDDELTA
jgi:hypothetical protein